MNILATFGAKILGGTAAIGLVSVPVINSASFSADDQSSRRVENVSASQGGVGSKKDLQKPVSARPAPVYQAPEPAPLPPVVEAPPAPLPAPVEAAVAPVAEKSGSSTGIILGVLAAAAVIGGILVSSGDDDDDENDDDDAPMSA